jgi:regulator of sigma E protease
METLLAFLVFIGVIVLVHEFGHFFFAKLFGVKVEVFSIGFGPPIFRKPIGETVYQIALLPLGGYVKLYGEQDEIKDDPRSFYAKPPWQRILIAFGGPLFNFLFAILVFWFVYTLPHEVPKYLYEPPKVGYVAPHSFAAQLGIKPGDVIIAVNGKPVKNWLELNELLNKYVGSTVTLKVKRNGKVLTLKVKLDFSVTKKGLGIEPYIPPVIGRVAEGFPAEQVGLKPGDRIVAINGKSVHSWEDITEFMKTYDGSKPIELTVERKGKIFTVTVIPKKVGNRYLIGISPKIETITVKEGIFEALKKGIEKTWLLSVLTVKAIWGIITGEISFKTLGGPLAIAGFAGETAKLGIVAFLAGMATLSVQLGLFNLIPLPLLDGGLILLFLIEMVRGKPLPEKFKEWWVKIGLVIIISLMLFIISQDIIRFLTSGRLMPAP